MGGGDEPFSSGIWVRVGVRVREGGGQEGGQMGVGILFEIFLFGS